MFINLSMQSDISFNFYGNFKLLMYISSRCIKNRKRYLQIIEINRDYYNSFEYLMTDYLIM